MRSYRFKTDIAGGAVVDIGRARGFCVVAPAVNFWGPPGPMVFPDDNSGGGVAVVSHWVIPLFCDKKYTFSALTAAMDYEIIILDTEFEVLAFKATA